MDVNSPQLFDKSGQLPPDSVLGSKYLNPDYLFKQEVEVSKGIFSIVTNENTIAIYHTVLYMLGIFFITIIFYSIIRVFEIRKKEHAHLHQEIEEYAHHHKEKEKAMAEGAMISKNERWRQVLFLLFSVSPNDWKLSVIEADAMLEVLLGELGFTGESLGDKLKTAGEKGFRNLDMAWEVHTIRNRIAHEGSIFSISHHEAKRVIAIYEQIFREFGYI